MSQKTEEDNKKVLVFSGGGARGFIYGGVIKALEEHNIVIQEYAGTSIGSIFVFLLNIGYSADELKSSLYTIDLDTGTNIKLNKLVEHYGFDSGLSIVNHIKDLMQKKNIDANITFDQLYQKTKKKLTVVGTNLSKHCAQYFNYVTSPDLKVIDGIRISIGIPILFTSVLYKGERFVDGGLTDNYPIHLFNKNDVIGFKLEHSNLIRPINSFEDYLHSLIHTTITEIERLKYTDCITEKNTLVLKTDVGTLDFMMKYEERERLFDYGYNESKAFLGKYYD